MAKDLEKIFSRMVKDMCDIAPGSDLLEECMSLNEEAIRHVPLRYRIIALGFVKRFSLDELNAKLIQQGCPKLYSRSFWEATLIFAFMHGYSFEDWKAIQARCRDIYASREGSVWFSERKITYAELERYVRQNSEAQGDVMATEMRTQYLERALMAVGDDEDALRDFLIANIHSFSGVREKTRYYFCKYLYYWLNRRIENYFEACRRGRGVDEALSELLCLKVVTVLRRNLTMPEAEKRGKIKDCAISCGEIFDAFNYFYFGYVSVDWVEALMECYERPEDMPAAHRKSLAQTFRKGRPEWKKLEDGEVIRQRVLEINRSEDEAYARDGNRGYNKKRDGENALHRYIRGERDVDRMVLIAFLLFFASDAEMPDEHRLTVSRMQDILTQCGYAALDVEDDVDWFVIEFLESKNPREFLTEVMLEYARHHENSFLYHVYGRSVQYEDELIRVMID